MTLFYAFCLLGQSGLESLKDLDLDPSLCLFLLGGGRAKNSVGVVKTSSDALFVENGRLVRV